MQMLQRQELKSFPGLKEMQEAHRQWLADFGWSQEYAWHGHPHAACSRVPGGTWQLKSFGYYLAADWQHRLYQSHRCSKCGMMVQHNQVCDSDGKPQGLITRLVVIP
jgi:hypothetical protein